MEMPIVKLSEVLIHNTDYIEPEPKIYPKLSVKLYGKGVVLDTPADGATLKMKRHQLAKPGQVILSEIWGKKGAIGLVPPEGDGALCTSHFYLFDLVRDKIEPGWLQLIFSANYLEDQLGAEAHGTTGYASVRPKTLLACEIPLPPLDEQRRTLAGVEHLSGMVERINILSRDLSISAESILQSSRNAIVTELRRRHPDTRLGDVCTKITDGPHVSPQYVDQGVPFISVRNVSETGIDFSTAKYVSPEDHALFSSKTHVEKGDVLYTKGGTTGVARRVDINREFSIWVHVALLKLKKDIVIPGYVEHMLNAPTSRTQAELFTHGSSNRDLGLSRMCNIMFPLAPIEEQFQIVSYLDGIMERVASLRELQLERKIEIEALMPSILDKAFKGEL